MEVYEIKSLAVSCEHAIRRKFSSLADNRFSEERMFNYGAIISADIIATNGGLYIALVTTLSRYYETKDKMNKIDNFIDKYEHIKNKRLDDITEIEEILKEFEDITK